MKEDQKRVSALLAQTVSLLCKNGLHFEKNLHIQGLLGITVDDKDVFIVHFDDRLWPKQMEKMSTSNDLPPSICSSSPNKNNNQLDRNQNEKNPEQQLDNKADNEVLIDNFQYSISQNHDESDEIKNEDHMKENDEIIFIKKEVSSIEERKENDTSSIISCNDSSQSIYNNELLPMNHSHQSFSNNFHISNITNKPPSERGRKRRIQRRTEDNCSMSPIENLENSLIPSYDNYHSYKNDLSNDLVKESWTYTKYHHSQKHSPKNIQSNYTSPSQNYQDNDSLMLFNSNRNDNHFNIINNSSSSNQQLQSTNSALPRRRSNMKTVVCQYPDCGKTFCHSCHLYRHQRLKHGHRFGVVAQASFKCQHPKCGKVFYRRSSLINHCLHVHSSSTESFHPSPSSQYPFPPSRSDNPPDIDNLLMECHNNGAADEVHYQADENLTMADAHKVAGCKESFMG